MRRGPRIVAELLLEFDTADEVLRRLADSRRLSPEVAEALAANDWTMPPEPSGGPPAISLITRRGRQHEHRWAAGRGRRSKT